MNIRGFKLDTGEIVIGDQSNFVQNECYTLENVVQLVIQDVGNGKMGVGMQPFIPFAHGSIEIMVKNIVALFEPDQQVENEYNRLFGSGLVVAPANVKVFPH